MAQIQFSLTKKKDWMSRTMATPQPSTSNNISSLPSPPPPHPTKTFLIKRNINMKVFEKEFKSNRFFRKTKTQTQAQQPCSKQGYRNFVKILTSKARNQVR